MKEKYGKDPNKPVYVYIIIYKRTNHVVYVGISWNVNDRIRCHLSDRRSPISKWLNAVLSLDELIDIKITGMAYTHVKAMDLEAKYIAWYRALNQANFNNVTNYRLRNTYLKI